jgi:hypothetical protein
MVMTGDLAGWGWRSEFERVVEFLSALSEAVGLPHERVAIVPGNHGVHRKACEAYFARMEADEREPRPPLWVPTMLSALVAATLITMVDAFVTLR